MNEDKNNEDDDKSGIELPATAKGSDNSNNNNNNNNNSSSRTLTANSNSNPDYDDGSVPPKKKSSVNFSTKKSKSKKSAYADYNEDEEDDVALGDAIAINNNGTVDWGREESIQFLKYSNTQVTMDEFKEQNRLIVTSHIPIYSAIITFILFVWYIVVTLDPQSPDVEEYHKLFIYAALVILYRVGKYVLKRIARRIDRVRSIGMLSFEITTEILLAAFYYFNLRKFFILFDIKSTVFVGIILAVHFGFELFQIIVRPTDLWFSWTPGLEIVMFFFDVFLMCFNGVCVCACKA